MFNRSIATLAFLSTILIAFAGCGDDGGDDGGQVDAPAGMPFGECPTDSQAMEMAGATAIGAKCTTCHGAALTGADRMFAPASVNFDTAAEVMQRADRVNTRAVSGTGSPMPPASSAFGTLDAAEIEAIRVYLACESTIDPIVPSSLWGEEWGEE